jgi:hypothetical protein
MTPVPGNEPPNFLIGYTDTVGGRAVVKTIGLLSGGEAEYVIPADATRFQASLGLSDSSDSGTSGVFTVFGDSTELAQQSLNRGYLATVSVSVKGYKVLRMGFTSISSGSTKADFGLARFTS